MRNRLFGCFQPRANKEDSTTHERPKTQGSHVKQHTARRSNDRPPVAPTVTAPRLCDSPSELAQVMQQRQREGQLEGQSIEHLQAAWGRDHQAMLRSLSGSLQV